MRLTAHGEWHDNCYISCDGQFFYQPKRTRIMNKLTKTLLLSGLVSLPFASGSAHAEDAPTLVPKISVYSEYEYRGISQTSEKPVLQFNLDYTHPSGFYLGTFLSNIKWLKDTAKAGGFSTNAQVEWDLF